MLDWSVGVWTEAELEGEKRSDGSRRMTKGLLEIIWRTKGLKNG